MEICLFGLIIFGMTVFSLLIVEFVALYRAAEIEGLGTYISSSISIDIWRVEF